MQLLASNNGKIGYINYVMSVYRKNEGALSFGIGKDVEFVSKKQSELLKYFNSYSNFKYNSLIEVKLETIIIEKKDYLLNTKSVFLYWIINPIKLYYKLIEKMKVLFNKIFPNV